MLRRIAIASAILFGLTLNAGCESSAADASADQASRS